MFELADDLVSDQWEAASLARGLRVVLGVQLPPPFGTAIPAPGRDDVLLEHPWWPWAEHPVRRCNPMGTRAVFGSQNLRTEDSDAPKDCDPNPQTLELLKPPHHGGPHLRNGGDPDCLP